MPRNRAFPMRSTLALAAATLGLLGLLAFASLRLAGEAMRSQAEARLRSTASVTAVFVAQHLNTLTTLVDSYAKRPNLIESLQAGRAGEEDLQQNLIELQRTQPGVAGAFLADLSGKLRAIAPYQADLLGRDYSYRDWFRGAVTAGKPYVSQIYFGRAAGNPRLTGVAALVREKDGQRPVAILTLAYSTAYIGSWVDDFARAQGVNVTITDQGGAVVASSEGVLPGTLVSLAHEPWVVAALHGRSGILERESGAGPTLTAYVPVQGPGWTVAISVGTRAVLAPLERLRNAVTGIALLLAFAWIGALAVLAGTQRAREQAETTLGVSEARAAGIIEAANEAFFSMDESGRVTTWNGQAERLFGWSRAEALGANVADLLVPPRLRERFQEGFARLREGKGRIGPRVELAARDRSGREFPVEVAAWVLPGPPISLHAFVQDITERRQAAAELARARDAANEASRLKSTFLANMSHEIRTPMNGILGMTELLLETELSQEQRSYLGMVQSSADALLRVINEILDFSKIEADRMEIDPEPTALHARLADLLKPLSPRAAEKGLGLILRIGPGVPDAVRVDFTRLGQVLLNLASNAIKFTERGTVMVSAALANRTDGGPAVRFSVSDTGIGIPQHQHEAIFEAFRQADTSTTRKFGGTGLGLSISARLVALMGGRLALQSAPGAGSTFSFEIVLPPLASSEAPEQARLADGLAGMRVLLLDSAPASREALDELARSAGMTPAPCGSADEAFRALEAARDLHRPFRLAVVDAGLLEGAGIEVLGRLRAHAGLQGEVIIASTGAAAQVARARAAGGARRYVKPLKASELIEASGSAAGPTTPTTLRRAPPAPGAVQGRRALVAEDNPVNQRITRAMLENHGYAVSVARNGREAVALHSGGSFDVILMDVQMPEMDGLEATAAIRRSEAGTGRRVPIVGVTAHAMASDREACIAAGMDGYVSKPLRQTELLEAIERFVQPRRAERPPS